MFKFGCFRGKSEYQSHKKLYKNCDLKGSSGCFNLGLLERQLVISNSLKSCTKSCDLKGSPGCFNLGLLEEKSGDIKSKKFYQKSCDLKNGVII